jgi:transcriptional regulator with PAS, ATPase and Fis domain
MSKYDTAMSLFRVVAGDRRTAQAVERVQRGLLRGLPVLLAGETGSGKELVARVLHCLSARSDGPFVPVNCGALPESLIEAELFGYADGAFTGARRGGAPGKFELANGGTLFLDEIGDMPMSSQTKLLRVLQERSVTRLADSRERPIDIALISATHHNLIELIAKGLFREDLYYRINGLGATLPPLRERSNILELAQFHLEKEGIAGRFELSEASRDLLVRHLWPGNLRQLGHIIASATAIVDRGCLIEPEHFPEEFVAQNVLRSRANVSATAQSSLLHEAEMNIIEKTIRECGGNISATARLLKISRSTIYNKWKRN